MLTKEELPECAVAATVQVIGSKWKLLILRNLLCRPWRFNELKKIWSVSARRSSRTACGRWRQMVSLTARFMPKCRPVWNTR